MTVKQIEQTFKSALGFLRTGKMKLALDKTGMLVDELQWPEISDQYNEILRNYRYMLQYFVQGANDPEQKTIFSKMTAKLIAMNFHLHEELLMRNSTAFEYIQKRYFPHKLHFRSSIDLFDSLNYYHNQTALLSSDSDENHTREKNRLRSNFEKLLPDLFSIFWLNTHYQQAEKQLAKGIMSDDYPGVTEKNLLISGLTLNIWRMFDEEKLIMLIDACSSSNLQAQQRALVGLCFILTRYDDLLPFFPAIRNRIMVLSDSPRVYEYLKNILILIVGTADTEKITRKMKEEILPEVMKISPIIKDKLESDMPLNSEDWDEENPEWQDILSQSGVADKLQELNELQLEGADVYMSTFAMLKNFGFFNEISNWFLPFDPEMLEIKTLFTNDDKTILNAFLGNSVICNSDKYSFCLSLLQMPSYQRDTISRNFKAEASQMEEITRDENLLKPDLVARNTARQYIQDLYRFFRLHPQHADFHTFFKYSLRAHEGNFFKILSNDTDLRTQLAEFYFNKGHYNQATELYEDIIVLGENTAAMYQKLAFCYQQKQEIEQALDCYVKADILQPDDLWTLRKIALCYKLSGDFNKALDQYRHIDFLQPGKFKTKMQIANCLTILHQYKQALKVYAELEEKDETNPAIWKAICWCAFVSDKIAQAKYYADKLLTYNPDATDYLNAGHIAFAEKNRVVALNYYLESLKKMNLDIIALIDAINNDSHELLKRGLREEDIMLMIDEIYYQSEML